MRIEYNPNRPDFSLDYGISRALKGIFNIETGVPVYNTLKEMGYVLSIEDVVKARPYIAAFVAKRQNCDDELIKQIISMQEDLHNGIGRNRRKASIGIHNLNAIKFPILYKTALPSHEFVPLYGEKKNLEKIISETEQGRKYGKLLGNALSYPILQDSNGETLSFPPVINSDKTKLDNDTNDLFIEVTGTQMDTVEDIITILASNLYEGGFNIYTVMVTNGIDESLYPNLDVRRLNVDCEYINRLLGLSLTLEDIRLCLERSRISVSNIYNTSLECLIPRYRTDISKQIDLVEEVVIGYGVDNLKPTYPKTNLIGNKNFSTKLFEKIRISLVGLGLLEIINYSLTDRKTQYKEMELKEPKQIASVQDTKSGEYEILRESLLPSSLQILAHNIHLSYPQNIFEIGKVFEWFGDIKERWHLSVVLADNLSNYTSIKMIAQSFFHNCFNKDISTITSNHSIYLDGRRASIFVDDIEIGHIGEVHPQVIDNFKIRVPISAFEIDLTKIIEITNR